VIPIHPLPPREGKILVGINVRDKFSDNIWKKKGLRSILQRAFKP
jgi:hypothetical protein